MSPFYTPWKRQLNVKFSIFSWGIGYREETFELKRVKHIWQMGGAAADIYFKIYTLFYKQHFFKQRQAEIGKKLSKS